LSLFEIKSDIFPEIARMQLLGYALNMNVDSVMTDTELKQAVIDELSWLPYLSPDPPSGFRLLIPSESGSSSCLTVGPGVKQPPVCPAFPLGFLDSALSGG
jgi:hypothetical protein